MTPERYDGKPFLRLIDCYVLDSIGELDSGPRKTLRAMEPTLQAVYKRSGTWQEIVRSQVQLPSAQDVLAEWRSRSAAVADPDPDAFVLDYVDGLGLA